LLAAGKASESVVHLQQALALEPGFATAHYNLGNTFLQMGRAQDALFHYNRAVEIDPNDAEARNNMAWILATWPEPGIRNGAKAVELAERADSLTRGSSPISRATLAAAYAEVGRFADAVKTAESASELASVQGNMALADSIRKQLEFYRSGSPFRDDRNASTAR